MCPDCRALAAVSLREFEPLPPACLGGLEDWVEDKPFGVDERPAGAPDHVGKLGALEQVPAASEPVEEHRGRRQVQSLGEGR
jgi:hypothetical protein